MGWGLWRLIEPMSVRKFVKLFEFWPETKGCGDPTC